MARTAVVLVMLVTLAGCVAYTTTPSGNSRHEVPDVSDPSFSAPEGTEFEDFDEPPMILKQTMPEYPSAARAAGIEGVVMLQVGIDVEGNVIEANVVEPKPGLSAAAVRAVRTWKFRPGMRSGEPVAVRIVVPIRFTLRD